MIIILFLLILSCYANQPNSDCSSAFCSQCLTNDTSICTSCIDNCGLINGKCKPSEYFHCKEMKNNKCLSCEYDYFLDFNTYRCQSLFLLFFFLIYKNETKY